MFLLGRAFSSLRHILTCCSLACSQESLWPTWTPAWQVTRRQPAPTLVRGSTCWTWSPLDRRSPRLQIPGSRLNSTIVLLCFWASSLAPIIWPTATPGGLLSKYNLSKWRTVPSLPFCMIVVLVLLFTVVYFEICCSLVIVQKQFGFDWVIEKAYTWRSTGYFYPPDWVFI